MHTPYRHDQYVIKDSNEQCIVSGRVPSEAQPWLEYSY